MSIWCGFKVVLLREFCWLLSGIMLVCLIGVWWWERFRFICCGICGIIFIVCFWRCGFMICYILMVGCIGMVKFKWFGSWMGCWVRIRFFLVCIGCGLLNVSLIFIENYVCGWFGGIGLGGDIELLVNLWLG